ncbi:competence/damage-inducible protein A [Frigidibacter mobilis]|uniref:Nucleotide-utilizing enzyme/competence-damage associated protein n=1 Tax=Frigidibacter mobilis TaxID=1335048 RepID=A0A159Z8R5_9RHOB|nr:molybdopterin-binding protein [Frigidibacter mobilis]AMY71927.1 nucleotide-utilizing enzyme/competence-damage associated protein [Frigidibacter mobilis]
MPNPTAAILVIGDEILSGRTREGNAHYLAGELTRTGIDLREIRVVPDDHEGIAAAVNALRAAHDHVFTSGGIGPTHDDITADAVAAAFGVPIGVRADAHALMAAHYEARGVEFNAARMRMARIPDGASLIENPVSIAPGFTLGNVHVMAGVPNVFQAMVASVLPTLTGGQPLLSQSLRLMRPEGAVAETLGALAAAHPGVSIGSYPFSQDGAYGTNLVVRGPVAAEVDAAMRALGAAFAGAPE